MEEGYALSKSTPRRLYEFGVSWEGVFCPFPMLEILTPLESCKKEALLTRMTKEIFCTSLLMEL